MNTSGNILVLLVDDHKIVRDGIISMLQDEKNIQIIAEAENGIDALDKTEKYKPDLIIMDLNMPIMDGIACTQKITTSFPDIKVLALTMLDEHEHIKNMIAAGAGGYILKNSGKDELVHAILSIHAGGNYFSEEVKNSLISNMIRKRSQTGKITGEPIPLTGREMDVLRLIVQEFTNNEIAEKLFISVRTVDAHRRNLLEKTGARNTAGLVRYAIENKLESDSE